MSEEEMLEIEDQLTTELGKVWNTFLTLPAQNINDNQEMAAAIHAAQNIVLARIGQRVMRKRRSDKP